MSKSSLFGSDSYINLYKEKVKVDMTLLLKGKSPILKGGSLPREPSYFLLLKGVSMPYFYEITPPRELFKTFSMSITQKYAENEAKREGKAPKIQYKVPNYHIKYPNCHNYDTKYHKYNIKASNCQNCQNCHNYHIYSVKCSNYHTLLHRHNLIHSSQNIDYSVPIAPKLLYKCYGYDIVPKFTILKAFSYLKSFKQTAENLINSKCCHYIVALLYYWLNIDILLYSFVHRCIYILQPFISLILENNDIKGRPPLKNGEA